MVSSLLKQKRKQAMYGELLRYELFVSAGNMSDPVKYVKVEAVQLSSFGIGINDRRLIDINFTGHVPIKSHLKETFSTEDESSFGCFCCLYIEINSE